MTDIKPRFFESENNVLAHLEWEAIRMICFGGSHMSIAKGLGDPSCKEFENHPIVFREVFDIALLRKAKYGTLFKQKN